jgi:hypothetical protein
MDANLRHSNKRRVSFTCAFLHFASKVAKIFILELEFFNFFLQKIYIYIRCDADFKRAENITKISEKSYRAETFTQEKLKNKT